MHTLIWWLSNDFTSSHHPPTRILCRIFDVPPQYYVPAMSQTSRPLLADNGQRRAVGERTKG